jgi:hypothetical protein
MTNVIKFIIENGSREFMGKLVSLSLLAAVTIKRKCHYFKPMH